MQGRYYFPRLAATVLLSLCLFTACRQEDKAVQPAAAQVAKLTFLTETLDNEKAAEADRKKAGELLSSLTFGEMESLIDLRHQYYLKTGIVDAQRAAYLLDLRHTLNRKAFELKGKPFHQLDGNHSEEIIQTTRWGKANPKATAGTKPNARTQGSCTLAGNPPCRAWKGDGSTININTLGGGDKEISGTYLGLRTFQCGANAYQDDCDYVFVYDYPKIYTYYFWKPAGVLAPLMSEAGAIKLIDNNPTRYYCGTYTLEILYGKTRIDFSFGTPIIAVQYMKLVLLRAISSSCYVGTSGTEKWYINGIYKPELNGWGGGGDLSAWPKCTCTVENYVTY